MDFARWLVLACFVLGCDFAEAKVSPWVDFRLVNGLVVIPTKVHGVKGLSAVDTGAQLSGIEQSFVEQHDLPWRAGKPQKILGVFGAETRKTYRDVPVTLMGADLVFKQLVGMNIDSRGQLLIGGDFLKTLYFQFDYPNKRLRAISRDAFDLQKISNVRSRLDPVTRQPMARVRLNDEHDAWLTIDTGNTSGVVMKRGPARKKKWLERYPAETSTSRGVTTTAETEYFRLPVISIGPYDVKNARVVVPAEGQTLEMFRKRQRVAGRSQKTQGLLGYDVLKNFLVTFDYKTGAMFIELPVPEAAQPEAEAPQ